MRKCSLNAVNAIFEEIAKSAKLYLPVDQADGSAAYKEWAAGVVWSDDFGVNYRPYMGSHGHGVLLGCRGSE